MTAKKPPPPSGAEVIHPHFSYRINSPIAIGVTGLGTTQQREAWKDGRLPMPTRLTEGGHFAYTGQQLIDLQASRLAKAQIEAELYRQKPKRAKKRA
jgi:hypothetical protein